jgi:hypothetical protein
MMKRHDHHERLRILSIKLREAEERCRSIGLRNTTDLSPLDRADLDADYALAQADMLRARREMDRAIASAAGYDEFC